MRVIEEFDVAVLGSGISGLATAVAARRLGLKTVVLEKAELVGGGTCYSAGLIWVGCNHIARKQGIADSPESVQDYLRFLGGGQEHPEQMDAFMQEAPAALEFFERCGIPFRLVERMADHYSGVAPGAAPHGRMLEAELVSGDVLGAWKERVVRPRNSQYCVTAEELVAARARKWDHDLIARRKQLDIRGLGVGLITHFLRAALEAGVDVRTGQAICGIVKDGDRASELRLADERTIRAHRAIVIATGGYESNSAMVRSFEGLPRWHSYFPPSLQGDGLALGSASGGAINVIQNHLQLFLGFPVPVAGSEESEFRLAGIIELCSPHTMVVNRRGMRFADESVFQRMAGRLREFDVDRHEYANLPCFLIFDAQYAQEYSFGGAPVGEIPSWVTRAASPRALAEALGIDPDGLEKSMQRFNGFAEGGADQDFGRRGDLRFQGQPTLGTLARPPFHGIELRPAGSSSAGLLTNRHAQVLDHQRRPIPGLYAVGNAAAKTELGTGYQAGLTLASGMTFGLAAARHAFSPGIL
jgi:3-oxosteroid 1-dehydrogenase